MSSSDTPRTDAFEALVIRPLDWWDFARELERENAALRVALATAEVGLKHALMMEPGDPFKRIKAITAALDAVRAARKEAQP